MHQHRSLQAIHRHLLNIEDTFCLNLTFFEQTAARGAASSTAVSSPRAHTSLNTSVLSSSSSKKQQQRRPVMVVFYVGGVTCMEIAALRCLAASKDFPYEIIIATTRIISGSSFIEALLPAFENGLAPKS
jgi:hypothetical protein